MSDQTPERDDSQLAAEYVIGVLPSDERAVVDARLRSDEAFADHVRFWEAHLAELNDAYGEIPPPASVKTRIDARLFLGSKEQTKRGWLGVWLAAAAIAALAGIMIIFWPAEPGLEATLVADGSAFQFKATANSDASELNIALIEGALEQGQVFELWTIPEGEAPISLGVFDPDGRVAVGTNVVLAEGVLLAVSLEPPGGSPTGQPTGPVVALGSLQSAAGG
jgi:anti-sigma-K factor RskA